MLEAKNLHKIYDNGKSVLHVLKGINLDVKKQEFVAIVGPSGAGKSTLLHILGGIDPPTEGGVFLEGQNIYKFNDKALSIVRNKKIGFVFQFYHLLSEFTVLENALLPALINQDNKSKKNKKENARALLNKVGLSQRENHFPSQLSGGEQQRLAIARALMNTPEILLCDEPTGNLDSRAGNEVFQLIKSLNRENKLTVVLVTHNQELTKLVDRVYILKDGILLN
jgi:ABC-type lipoprotein export system ATPase subunit